MTLNRTSTVFKLGGSVLQDVDWPHRLRAWLNRQRPGNYFGIVGGGLLIEALRDLDNRHSLSQPEMHWRAIRLLDATFEIASELTPNIDRIVSSDELNSIDNMAVANDRVRARWVRIAAFYNEASLEAIPLEYQPALGWTTTSDSLALFLAYRIRASRCVLLKSCSIDPMLSLEQAVVQEIIDPECLRFRSLVPTIELVQL